MFLHSPDMATISRIQRTVPENEKIPSERRPCRGGGGGGQCLADIRGRRSEWSDLLKSVEKGNRRANNHRLQAKCAA